MTSTETKRRYRVLENSEETWQGSAWDQEHALERCYGAHDESVPTLMLVELQELKPVKISSKMSAPGWVTVWTNG